MKKKLWGFLFLSVFMIPFCCLFFSWWRGNNKEIKQIIGDSKGHKRRRWRQTRQGRNWGEAVFEVKQNGSVSWRKCLRPKTGIKTGLFSRGLDYMCCVCTCLCVSLWALEFFSLIIPPSFVSNPLFQITFVLIFTSPACLQRLKNGLCSANLLLALGVIN